MNEIALIPKVQNKMAVDNSRKITVFRESKTVQEPLYSQETLAKAQFKVCPTIIMRISQL